MATVIMARPRLAWSAVLPRFGMIENRPYTNSMCTQYTSSEVMQVLGDREL